MKKIAIYLTLLLLFCAPTVLRMVRVGIYSMQDFHYFRLVEFDKCVSNFQIPCRWAPDAGLGYGEPLFNFYGQASYFLGELFHLVGFSYIDSLKLLFAFSLLASGVTMFFLGKRIWNDNWAGFVSSILYVYAPYRAVDVWVRAALPEAMSFVIIPLAVLYLDRFFETKKHKDLLLFSIFLALLILNHNLSLLLFAPFLVVWTLCKLYKVKEKVAVGSKLFCAICLSFLLSAFYLLPVIYESQFVNLNSTIQGYFNFRAHFTTIPQLLFSRFWGYGGSTWGDEDNLSLAIGHIQWILPLFIAIYVFLRKEKRYLTPLIVLIGTGWVSLFLTHNKSTSFWETLSPMAYIQFPWRFLSLSLFCFALASGCVIVLFKKYKALLAIGITFVALFLNISFFKEDIWYDYSDSDLTTGYKWVEQTRASIGDYWPIYGPVPINAAPENIDQGQLVQNTSNSYRYQMTLEKDTTVEFPITYFPGWALAIGGNKKDVTYSKNGLIAVDLPSGEYEAYFHFENTSIRAIGNFISLVALLGIGVYLYVLKK